MTGWFDNPGHAPVWRDDVSGGDVPEGRIAERDASTSRVYVRLRNGSEPAIPWPVIGRTPTTRWSLTGDDYDIVAWRRA